MAKPKILSEVEELQEKQELHQTNDAKHGVFSMDGKRYQGQWVPNADLTGMKFTYEEVL